MIYNNLNKQFGNYTSMTTKTSLKDKEYWLKHGDFSFGDWTVSVIGGLNSDNTPVPEDLDKVIVITRERLLSEQHYLVSVVIDRADFMPISSLQTGVRQSLAVCRISRYFSRKDFRKFIEEIEQAVQKIGNHINPFDSVAKVKEIFSIPNQVADDIEGFKDSSNLSEVLKNISEVQLAKINPIPIGTGFIVGGTHLLTNNHVIPNREIAKQCVAQFNYVGDQQGRVQEAIDYELNPELLFITEPSLDYTLVQLQSGMFTRQAGFNFNWIQLIEDDENIAPGGIPYLEVTGDITESVKAKLAQLKSEDYQIRVDKIANTSTIILWHHNINNHEKIEETLKELQELMNSRNVKEERCERKITTGDMVIIVQHPKGKLKQIAYDKVISNGLYKNFLRYKTDSDYGSSGSPVFNAQWDLVALHHAAVAAVAAKLPETYQQTKLLEVESQQGVRICRIVEDLKRKSVSKPKLQSFIEDFVVTYEALNYPPLPSALKFDGESSYIDLGTHESLNITEAITVEAWIQCNPMFEDGMIVHRDQAYSLYWRKGNIAVRLQNDKQHKIFFPEKGNLNDNLWHHITFTWDTKEIKIYIDGEKLKIRYSGGDQNFLGNLGKSGESLIIGCNQNRENYFSGSIAELRIWGVIRTQEQIKANMYRRLNQDEREGLRGYWRFEEGKGYKVYNLAKSGISSLQSIDKFILNPQIKPQFGLQLNGKNDYINCGDDESLKIEEAITLEAWVKNNEPKNEKNNELYNDGIIVNRGGSWGEEGYSLWRYLQKIRVELKNDREGRTVDTEKEALNDGLWHHITFTWDKKSQDIQIYIDGTRQKTNSQPFIGPIGKPKVSLNIGQAQDYGYYFNGSIAEVRLWEVARTENEIQENMASLLEGNKEGLVGYWRLDEEEGDRAENKVNENNYGLVHGGQWLKPYSLLAANQGAFGVAFRTKRLRASQYPALPLPFGLKFNEESDRVECSGEEMNTSTVITVEAWVKHKFGNFLIVSRGGIVKQDGRVDKGYSLSWYNGKIRVCLSDGTSERAIVYSRENAPSDRLWHQIAFTWEQSSQEIAIYIDGRRQDSIVEGKSNAIVFEGQNKSIGLFAGTIDNPANLIIGQKDTEEIYYNVAIAEVRLWNVVRTQDQIKTNMSFRLDVEQAKNEGLIGYWRLDDGGEGNNQARNHASERHHGTVYGAKWFPAKLTNF